jgi:hypothetical protein
VSSPTIDCSRRFISSVVDGIPPSNEELIRLLDELAQAYHACPLGEVTDANIDIPRQKYLHSEIGVRFPKLGWYSTADPSDALPRQTGVGDAIDDLADIVRDLQDVISHYEALGLDDAHWMFRFLFRIHWGGHLRHLALYLHTQVFEA